jgi:hypothetical protein
MSGGYINHNNLVICGLFSNAVSSSDYIASKLLGENELERMWKESAMA